MIVAGLDLSMSSTGLAIVDTHKGAAVHRIRTPAPRLPKGQQPTLLARAERLNEIETRIGRLLGFYPIGDSDLIEEDYRPLPDLLVVEQPFGSMSGNTIDLIGNWWRVVGMIHRFGIPTIEVGNTKLKLYAVGRASNRGPTKVEKHHVVTAVKTNYGRHVARMVDGEGDDVCDAFILAAIGCRLAGQPIEATTLPQDNLRALENLSLPEGITQ